MLFRCHLPVTSSSRNDVASAWFRESYYYPLPSVFKYCVLYDWVVFILAAGRQDWSFLVAMATSCYEGVTYGIIVLMHFFLYCGWLVYLRSHPVLNPSLLILDGLKPEQNGRHFADDGFKCIFLNENVRISIKISLKFDHSGSINNIPALVQIMVCWWPGDKPLSEQTLVSLLMYICVTRPQWVNSSFLILDALKPEQNGWHLADDNFKCILMK